MPNDDSSEANSNVKLVPGIKPPQRFNFGTNILENWKIFKHRWQTYAILSQLESQPAKVQVALFLHTLADDALRVGYIMVFNLIVMIQNELLMISLKSLKTLL